MTSDHAEQLSLLHMLWNNYMLYAGGVYVIVAQWCYCFTQDLLIFCDACVWYNVETLGDFNTFRLSLLLSETSTFFVLHLHFFSLKTYTKNNYEQKNISKNISDVRLDVCQDNMIQILEWMLSLLTETRAATNE